MLKILLFLALSTTTTYLCAQALSASSTRSGSGANIADHLLIAQSRSFGQPKDAERIDGTPYLQDDFQEGSVITTKGVAAPVPMRYHIEGDYVEFKQKDVTYILDPSPEIKKISFQGTDLVVDNYNVKGKPTPGFYVLLDSGKLTLLMKKNMTLHPAQPPKAIETEGKPAQYQKLGDDFFYKLDGGPVTEISSVKKLVEVLKDHQDEVKAFVSKEKISKKELELVRLVEYYNQL